MSDMSTIDPSIIYGLFKGDPGTRKSTAALSFPTPQYWFSWDRKMPGMMIPMLKWGMDPKQIKYDDYENWNDARTKLEQLQTNCPFKTIIIDSITSCADMTLRQTRQMKKGVTRSSGNAAGKSIAGISVNEIEDYNAESSALNELIALTKDIHIFHKVNVILIAHVIQAEYKSPSGETHFSRTIVTAGKRVAPKIPAYCGEVYHFNIDKGVVVDQGGDYALLTEHTGDDFARTGLPLPKKIVFNERPLYRDFLLPAIEKLKQDAKQTPITLIK